jgi:hypothetical protein
LLTNLEKLGIVEQETREYYSKPISPSRVSAGAKQSKRQIYDRHLQQSLFASEHIQSSRFDSSQLLQVCNGIIKKKKLRKHHKATSTPKIRLQP